MTSLLQDARDACRGLRRKPAVALAAILALALGIGATTSMVSVIDVVDFRPLPYRDGDRLVVLHEIAPPTFPGCHQCNTSPATFQDWQAQSTVYDAMAAQRTYIGRWLRGDETEALRTATISPGLFSLLGVRPALGRGFLPADLKPDAEPVVLLADDIWRQQLAADPHILGRTLTLISYATGRRQDYTVIGVMPAGFDFFVAKAWMPLPPRSAGTRGDHSLQAFAHLKQGATLAQANAELNTIARRLASEYPATNRGWKASVVPLRTALTEDFGRVATGRFVLLGLVACILTIVTANVAGLLVAQTAARQRELAIRAALGASPAQLRRPLLLEGLILALAGGAGGMLLAAWGVRIASVGLGLDRAGINASVDTRVLSFALLASIGVGLACDIVRTRSSRANDLQSLLRGDDTTADVRRGALLQRGLIIVEVAATLALLVGASVLGKGLLRLERQVPGYDPRDLYRLMVHVPRDSGADAARRRQLARSVVERVGRVPGVVVASTGSLALMPAPLRLERSPTPLPLGAQPAQMSVGPAFFRTLRTTIVRGRAFTPLDGATAPPVAIVNEAAVASLWPGRDPVGRRILVGGADTAQWVTIVGVAANTKLISSRLTSPAMPILYRPFDQAPQQTVVAFARAATGATGVGSALRALLKEVSSGPIDQNDLRKMEEVISRDLADQRFNRTAVAWFAGISLVLAAVGIHGAVAHAVARRTREIGIRIALGARRRDVLALVVREGFALALLGLILGAIASFALMRVLRWLFVGVAGTTPVVLGEAALFILTVVVLASYLPARKAIRVDPVIAFRSQ